MQRMVLRSVGRAAAPHGHGHARLLRRPAAAPFLGVRRSPPVAASQQAVALSLPVREQLRWCITSGIPDNATSSGTAVPPPAPASTAAPSNMAADGPAGAGEATESATTYPPEVEAQIKAWQERLKHLSREDQDLIISSLLHPEKQKPSVMGGPGIGPKDANMVAAFTCGKCDFRMVKKFSKHAYTKGIVIVECPNCRVKHLLADNLGWLEDEAKNIEDILREKGESFVRIGDGDYEAVNSSRHDDNDAGGADQKQQPTS